MTGRWRFQISLLSLVSLAQRFGVCAHIAPTLGVCVAGAFLFPFPATKLVLAVILGLVYLRRLNEDMAFGLALVAFTVPVEQFDTQPSQTVSWNEHRNSRDGAASDLLVETGGGVDRQPG